MVRQGGDHDKRFRAESRLMDMHPEFSHVEEFRHLLVGFHVHPRGSRRCRQRARWSSLPKDWPRRKSVIRCWCCRTTASTPRSRQCDHEVGTQVAVGPQRCQAHNVTDGVWSIAFASCAKLTPSASKAT